MPVKLSSSAGTVIADALERARAERTSQIGEEHLLAALLGNPDSQPLLGGLGGPQGAEAVWADVRRARRRAGLTAGEQQARPADQPGVFAEALAARGVTVASALEVIDGDGPQAATR